MKKLLTAAAVLLFFAWGTVAWGTGDFLLAENLPFLSLLRNVTYAAAVAAVFMRFALRRVPNEAFLVVGSALCAVSFVVMAQGGDWVPIAYLVIGLTRIVLIPANLGFAAATLGPKLGVVVTAGGFYAANAVGKPIIARLVERDQWRAGLLIGAALVVASVVATWLARSDANQSTSNEELGSAAGLGYGALAFVGIQVSFGLVNLLVFPLALELTGKTTDAGTLEAIRQSAMFLGVVATLVYQGRFSIRMWLTAQLAGYLALLVGFQLGLKSLVYLGLIADGISFAILERATELAYLAGVHGLPSAAVVLQLLDAGTRIALIPGEAIAAALPVQATVWIAPLLPFGLLLLLATPLPRWLSAKLLELARKE